MSETATRIRRADAVRNAEAIVEAASKVLAQDPSASVQDVATSCQLHRATVHRHFASRDDLIHAVRVRAYRDVQDRVDEIAADTSLAPVVALERIAATVLEVGDRYRVYRFAPTLGPSTDQERQDIRVPFESIIRKAQRSGDIRKDVPAKALTAAFGGLLTGFLPRIAEGEMSAKKAAKHVITLLGA